MDVNLAHLDRPFDYQVPEQLADQAVPGARVRVRFAGRLVDGFVLAREDTSRAHRPPGLAGEGRLPGAGAGPRARRPLPGRRRPLRRDARRRPAPRGAAPARAGGGGDAGPGTGRRPGGTGARTGWGAYPRGPALLEALPGGRPAHAVWQALPGEDWPARLAEAAATTAAAGRGAVLVVPDRRDLDRVQAACEAAGAAPTASSPSPPTSGPPSATGAGSPWPRAGAHRRRHPRRRVRPGRRPGPDRGLGRRRRHARRAPRALPPRPRRAMPRAHRDGAALLVAGFARTAEAALLVASGWAHDVVADRATVRARGPRVTSIGEDDRQLLRDPRRGPPACPAWRSRRPGRPWARAPGARPGPRAGLPARLACARCREPARCRRCAGPMALPAGRAGGDRTGCPGRRMPLVRDPRRRLPLRRLRLAPAAGPGRRLRPHRRGAGPRLPADRCAAPAAGRRCSTPCPAARPGRRDAGRRAAADGGYGAALLLDGPCCSPGPTCGRGRRRCAAGSAPPPSCARRPRAGGWS